MTARDGTRIAALALLLVMGACTGVDLGDNPGHEFPKETGPLTVPPVNVRNGTAQ